MGKVSLCQIPTLARALKEINTDAALYPGMALHVAVGHPRELLVNNELPFSKGSSLHPFPSLTHLPPYHAWGLTPWGVNLHT